MLSSPKIFRGGGSCDTGGIRCVCGTPGLNGTQSRVRTSRPCFSHDKSTRHSGALQMTSAPAYNWYVSNQYLDTRDTVTPGMFAFGWHRRHRRLHRCRPPSRRPARLVPQLLGPLQRCSGINYYPRILPPLAHPGSPPQWPPARPTMSPDAATADKVAFWANASRWRIMQLWA